jgi:phytoene synthase
MMALVMGPRAAALARACELGVAMQLTNIARDVGEDARNGRLYLPRSLAARGRHRPRRLACRAALRCRALGSVVQRLLDAAELLYRRSEQGVALPRDCRPAIQRGAAGLRRDRPGGAVSGGCGCFAAVGRAGAARGRAATQLGRTPGGGDRAVRAPGRSRPGVPLTDRDPCAAAVMSQNLPVILVEVVLIFGGVLAFAWWQLRDLNRERQRREAAEPDKSMGDEDAST